MMTIKLFIVLSVFLNHRSCCLIVPDEFDSNQLLEVKPVVTDINDKWLVNFVRTIDNKYEICQVMPIKQRVFIADAECIYHAAKIDHWAITIDFVHGINRYADMASVQDKNIFYNANLTSDYDPNKRKIALLFSDQPVFADGNRALIRGIAQMAYQEVSGYNEANQIKKLAFNISDTNYSKCFMLIFKGTRIRVPCYGLNATFTSCMYTLTDYTFSQYDNLLNFLICHTTSSKQKVVLVGVLSRPNKPSISLHERLVPFEFENIDDLSPSIYRNTREWFAGNPHQPIYPLY